MKKFSMLQRSTAAVGAIALGAAGLAGLAIPANADQGAAVGTVQSVAAQSQSYEVSDASVTWGLRQSFRNYITGFIAQGSVTPIGGTIADSSNIITWENGTGTLESPDTLTGEMKFSGGVSYLGHEGAGENDGYGLDVDLENPTIKFQETADGVTGVLYIDAYANPYGGAAGIDAKQVAFANLTFSDDFAIEGDQLSGTATATLHEDGVAAFVGMYDAGTELDPLTISATISEAVAEVTPEAPVQDGAQLTIPAVDGVEYFVDGESVAAGAVALEDGVAVEVTAQATDGHVLAEGAKSSWSFEYKAPVVADPQIAVSKTSDLNPEGETITISGSGFDSSFDAPPYLPADKAGFYVQVGWIDETWRPSEGAESVNRSNAYSVWVQGANSESPYMLWDENEDGTVGFTWEVTIDKETLDEKQREGAQLAIFTIGAGGTTQAVNEIAVPISFAEETTPEPEPTEGPSVEPTEEPSVEPTEDPTGEPTVEPSVEPTEQPSDEPTDDSEAPVVADPQIAVSKSSDLNPAGETITISGSGFDSSFDAPPYLPVNKAGFYVQVGWIDEAWRPSEGAESVNRSNAYSVWVQDTNAESPYMLWEENEDGTVGFTWEVTIDKETLDEKQREGAQLAIFTIGAGGTTQAVNEIAIPISFAEESSPEPEPIEEPSEEPTEEPSVEPTEQPSEEPSKEPSEEPTEDSSEEPSEGPFESTGPEDSDGDDDEDNSMDEGPDEENGRQLSDLTDDNRGEIVVPGTATVGSPITVNVGEAYAGLDVTAVLFSNPHVQADVTVNDDGTFSVILPKDVAGEYKFAVYYTGETGAEGVIGWSTMTITNADVGTDKGSGSTDTTGDKASGSKDDAKSGSQLAKTGAQMTLVALGGLALLGAGAVVMVAARRRNGNIN